MVSSKAIKWDSELQHSLCLIHWHALILISNLAASPLSWIGQRVINEIIALWVWKLYVKSRNCCLSIFLSSSNKILIFKFFLTEVCGETPIDVSFTALFK